MDVDKKIEEFLQKTAPRLGPAVLGQIGDMKVEAMISLLIEKGVFTQEELDGRFIEKLEEMGERLMKMPIPSPIQPDQKK